MRGADPDRTPLLSSIASFAPWPALVYWRRGASTVHGRRRPPEARTPTQPGAVVTAPDHGGPYRSP